MAVKRPISKMAEELRLYWRKYVGQSVLATVALFAVFLVLKGERAVILSSIGATAFIVFAMPDSVTAGARNVIGGHAVGFLCGLAGAFYPQADPPVSYVVVSVAVGLSMFVMVVTDTEHPPAAGTALGIAMEGTAQKFWAIGLAVLASVVILSAARRLLRRHLRDLV